MVLMVVMKVEVEWFFFCVCVVGIKIVGIMVEVFLMVLWLF